MAESIGKQLMAARKKAGLTIEDIAFKTRVPATRLSELENDDFSNFANLTYAKGFLKIYSSHLGVDINDYLNEFDTRELANIYGHEYAQSAQQTGLTYSQPQNSAPPPRLRKLAVLLLVVAALIVCPILFMQWLANDKKPETASPAPAQPTNAEGTSGKEGSGGSSTDSRPLPKKETALADASRAKTVGPEPVVEKNPKSPANSDSAPEPGTTDQPENGSETEPLRDADGGIMPNPPEGDPPPVRPRPVVDDEGEPLVDPEGEAEIPKALPLTRDLE